MKGYIHSLQSLGTVDGPGVRAVVFTEGCPLRCVYCHNPDTWTRSESDLAEHTELAQKILRLYPYIKDGGVTFSGGEPCLEADFIFEVVKLLKE
jgi:pyruvate formate lyase activating enzyme